MHIEFTCSKSFDLFVKLIKNSDMNPNVLLVPIVQ
jgi:hypothetical protein